MQSSSSQAIVQDDGPKPRWSIKREVVKGDGNRIEEGDIVTIEFIATLNSGKEIANTYKRGLSYTIQADKKGDFLAEVVVGMRETGEREATVRLRSAGISGVVPGDEPILVWVKIDGFSPSQVADHPALPPGKTEPGRTSASG